MSARLILYIFLHNDDQPDEDLDERQVLPGVLGGGLLSCRTGDDIPGILNTFPPQVCREGGAAESAPVVSLKHNSLVVILQQ